MTILDPQPIPLGTPPGAAPLPKVDPITRLPILILFPHSRCNCRCLMCDIWREHDARPSSRPVTSRVGSSEWRGLGVRRVVLSGGEALMHSHLWELCDILRAADIGITILSTGLLLRQHAAELVARCDDVVVSLDGPAADSRPDSQRAARVRAARRRRRGGESGRSRGAGDRALHGSAHQLPRAPRDS